MAQLYETFLSEIFQRDGNQSKAIYKLLNSKRLLSDHIETLEIAVKDVELQKPVPSKIFSFTKGTFLVAVAALSSHTQSWWKYVLPVISISYVSLYAVKTFNKLKNKMIMKRIEKLINLFDQFEMCIKRNLLFFNEIHLNENAQVHRKMNIEYEREVVFQNSVKSVVTLLSDQLVNIENLYALPPKYDHIYEKLEDIKNSEPFVTDYTKFTAKEAKLFYKIFAYVQSHYLMRFGLIAAYHPVTNVIFCDFPKVRKLLNTQIQEHVMIFEKLTKPSNKVHYEMDRRIKPAIADDVTHLKNNSLNFSSKTMIFANDCRNLDSELQKAFNLNENDDDEELDHKNIHLRDSLLNILPRLQAIENNFDTCREEFERFHLSFNKFLNDKYSITHKLDENLVKSAENGPVDDDLLKPVKTVDESTKEVPKDDFFLVDGGAGDITNDASNYEEDLINTNSRLVKSYFKPVLNQLKEKIDPINEKMKIKEKEILASKGINLTDELDDEHPKHDHDDDSLDDQPTKKFESKYNENRDFLISKTQFSAMQAGIGPVPFLSMVCEDVIGDTDEDDED